MRIAGHEKYGQALQCADTLPELRSAHARHHQVREQQVHGCAAGLDRGQGSLGLAAVSTLSRAVQNALHGAAHQFVVLHQQNDARSTGARHPGGLGGASARRSLGSALRMPALWSRHRQGVPPPRASSAPFTVSRPSPPGNVRETLGNGSVPRDWALGVASQRLAWPTPPMGWISHIR